MGRRTSGQTVGLQTIGNIQASANTLTTTQANQNLALDPNGTGAVDVFASITINGDMSIANQGDLRLLEASSNGTNYIAMQAASSMATNYTITWPATVSSTNGFVLTTDTSGNLSWASAGGNISVSDPGSSATVHYPFFGTNAGAVPTAFSPSARTNLTFVPSTGELTATIGSFANVYGSTSTSGTLTIRGTTSGTKATASVLMTDNVASSSTTTGTLVVTGGVGISGQVTAATIVETSSIAFKENVSPIDNALDLVMQLAGVTYDRKDNKEHEAGLIAEQVYKIIPDLVSLDANGNPHGIKYTKLTAYLLESIKSLKVELDVLKGKN
jgi:hypothetical protein